MKTEIKITVRELVEYVMRSGDLIIEFARSDRAVEGIQGHKKVRKLRQADYIAEQSVTFTYKTPKIDLKITGRIDGIYEKDSKTVVEEIKTVTRDPESLKKDQRPAHWAQAKVYAYIYALQNKLEEVLVQLTYFQIQTEKIKEFTISCQLSELKEFFTDIAGSCLSQIKKLTRWRAIRNESIERANFPFGLYRPGQREMAVGVYRAIRDKNNIIIQAPTGIGKTIAALFPALKAMGQGLNSKIFYLTARSTGRQAAQQAIDKLREHNLSLKSISITAQKKICFNPDASCHPDECGFAKGHFDRVNDALEDAFSIDSLTPDIIEQIAEKYRVCPFEFSLDLAGLMDCIICDYNYAFDPRVFLRRFFLEQGHGYTFLIDEAHNLVDRARDMFSAQIEISMFSEVKEAMKGRLKNIYGIIERIEAWMTNYAFMMENNEKVSEELPFEFYTFLKDFLKTAEKWLIAGKKTEFRKKIIELYFEVSNFIRTAESMDEMYSIFFEKEKGDLKIRLFCMDPSVQMEDALQRCDAAVFFSATMTPIKYFCKMFGCGQDTLNKTLRSPFPQRNLGLFIINTISTFYNQREKTADRIASAILEFINHKKGNYLIFFPSYKYMSIVCDIFCKKADKTDIILQTPYMSEKDRQIFLSRFSEENSQTLVGFAVMGGIFGEGIDLVGDRLTGAAIVGVGLPGICMERELIKKHFESSINAGFEFAYMYPGINRVLQAAGRVIRSENDKGVILLIDSRFSMPEYKSLLPAEWRPVWTKSSEHLKKELKKFWY